MNLLDNFVRTYSDKIYKHTAMVRHKGTVIAFAMDNKQKIWFSVLNLENTSISSPIDVNYWQTEPQLLYFPNELGQIGYRIAGLHQIPEENPEVSFKEKTPDEIWLSTTGRLTADAEFQVLSDGQHIFVFRQSISHKYNPHDPNDPNNRMIEANGQPVVNKTLLIDRFVFTGGVLKPKLEVRFQRSRHKDKPFSRKDSLSSKDLDGNPFYEPTHELELIKNLEQGRFSVLLLPTATPSLKRWQIFAYNSATKRIDSFNIERSVDGLFNLEGTLHYTSPLTEYQDNENKNYSVFEDKPGPCPFSGLDLIPIVETSGYAETSLEFDGVDDYVAIKKLAYSGTGEPEFLPLIEAITVEAWFKTVQKSEGIIASWDRSEYWRLSVKKGKIFWATADTSKKIDDFTGETDVADGEWHHVAVTYNQATGLKQIFVDGNLDAERTAHDGQTLGTGITRFGFIGVGSEADVFIGVGTEADVVDRAINPKDYFKGQIDELRVWNRARSQGEIKREMSYRLIGNELELVGYWRFDEGHGTDLFDQTDRAQDGEIRGAKWASSDAPVGDHPSIRRSSFKFEQREVVSGISSVLYYQQEQGLSGYDPSGQKPAKKNARVMMAVATSGAKETDDENKNHIAILDFAVSKHGKIALMPDTLPLPLLINPSEDTPPINAYLNEIAEKQNDLDSLLEQKGDIVQDIQKLQDEIAGLPQKIREVKELTRQKVSLQRQRAGYAKKSATFYEHAHFKGKSFTWSVGSARNVPKGWNDRISSLRWDHGVRVEMYQHIGFEGHKAVVEHDVREGRWYNDDVSSIKVLLTSSFNQSLSDVDREMEQVEMRLGRHPSIEKMENDIAGKTKELDKKNKQLIGINKNIDAVSTYLGMVSSKVNGEVNVEMPLLSMDVFGYTLSGGLLNFAYTKGTTPTLFESANGKVNLYFRGGNDQFFTTYFDTNTAKSTFHLPVQKGNMVLIARNAEKEMADTELEIVKGSDDDHCNLRMTNPVVGVDESWKNLPRDHVKFVKILNGKASDSLDDDMYYDYDNRQISRIADTKSSLELLLAIKALNQEKKDIDRKQKDKIAEAEEQSTALTQLQKNEEARLESLNQKLAGLQDTERHRLFQEIEGLRSEGMALQAEIENRKDKIAEAEEQSTALTQLQKNEEARLESLNQKIKTLEHELADLQDAEWDRLFQEIEGLRSEGMALQAEIENRKDKIAEAEEQSTALTQLQKNEEARLQSLNQKIKTLEHELADLQDAEWDRLFQEIEGLRFEGIMLQAEIENRKDKIAELDDRIKLLKTRSKQIIEDEIAAKQEELDAIPKMEFSSSKGSILFIAASDEAGGNLQNCEISQGLKTKNCKWVAYSQGNALALNGENQYAGGLVEETVAKRFNVSKDITLESWVRPDTVDVWSGADLIHQKSNGSAYSLGLKGQALWSALKFDGVNDYVEVPYNPNLNPNLNPEQFTISCWAKVTGGEGSYRSPLTSRSADAGSRFQGYMFYAGEDGKWQVWVGNNTSWQKVIGSDVKLNRWTHICATYAVGGTDRLTLYINGQKAGDIETTYFPNHEHPLRIGAGKTESSSPNYHFNGQISEVCLWNHARSVEKIRADMNRQLGGYETGLNAYWRYENGQAKDFSENHHHGVLKGDVQSGISPIKAYKVYMGVNNQKYMTQEAFSCGSWTHLAGVFNQSFGLEFDGNNDYVDCGNDGALNVDRDLTIEVFLQVNQLKAYNPIISKGTLNDGIDGGVPYHLSVNGSGNLVLAYENSKGQKIELQSDSDSTLEENHFYRVAVSRKFNTKPGKGEKDFHTIRRGTPPKKETFEVELPGKTEEWFDFDFYIDGKEVGHTKYKEVDVATNGQNLIMGGDVTANEFFAGVISEVRLWSKVLEPSSIGGTIMGYEQGLLSWWRLEENEGSTTEDAKGSAHGAIKGATWGKNPDPKGSEMKILVNGTYQETKKDSNYYDDDSSSPQISIGAKIGPYYRESENDGPNVPQNHLNGELDEIRIWKVARTQEQIQDNMFRRLLGEKGDLLAYFQCDAESGLDPNKPTPLTDQSGRGNHLNLVNPSNLTSWPISTAPVSYDTPQSRNALAKIKTNFNQPIHSKPDVQEYGDMQFDAENNRIGALKRCYAYIHNGHWKLITGFKVGNLITEWVAQVQYDPQLMGYIEGAPPVPGENITAGPIDPARADYIDSAGITLTEADAVTYNYSSSKESGLDTSFDLAASAGFDGSWEMVVAPLGIGITQPMSEIKVTAGIKGNFESSNSIAETQSAGITKTTTKKTTMSLGGNWEPPQTAPKDYEIPTLGRRFVPANVGMALVESATADVFALRLSHNNALVAYRIVPNPDIPKDWNIITFPINPTYTKQGTLDGKIGCNKDGSMYTDREYPNAVEYGEWSYFKPKEAYALKKKLKREEERLRNYYENLEVSALGGAGIVSGIGAGMAAMGGALGLAAIPISTAIGGAVDAANKSSKMPKGFVKSGLINTYVWTADGGFFAETQESSLTKQETMTSSFSLSGKAGGGLGTKFDALGAEITMEMNAMLGGHLTLTSVKDKEATSSYGMEISLGVPGDLQKYHPKTLVRQYDERGDAVIVPGKVDAYRFMTFYLTPDVNNFDHFKNKVVNFQWLMESNHPNAIALREAIKSQQKAASDSSKSLPWRVMHRVTYISRILPEVDDTALTNTERVMKEANISSNFLLIKKIEPFVKDKVDAGYVEFTDAVRAAVKRYLPELVGAMEDIINYMCLYYQVFDDLD